MDIEIEVNYTTNNYLMQDAIVFIQKRMKEQPNYSIHVLCGSKRLSENLYQALKNDTTVIAALVNSDVSGIDKCRIAKDWENGLFNVMISTTSFIVGADNDKVNCVLILGYLPSLLTVAQGILRIRPSQQGKNALVHFKIPKINENIFNNMLREAFEHYQLLQDADLLENVVSLKLYSMYYARVSVKQWLDNIEICRKNLYFKF